MRDFSKYGQVVVPGETGKRDFSKYGQVVQPQSQTQEKSNKSLLGFIASDLSGKPSAEAKPEGGLSGFVADTYQTYLGSGALTGLAQAPVRPIATAVGAKQQEDIQGNRLELTKTADNFISMATKATDPAAKKKYLKLAADTLKQGEALNKTAQDINKETPQSTSNMGDIERVGGQAINTGLLLSPFAKGALAAKAGSVMSKPTLGKQIVSSGIEGAKIGGASGVGTAMSEEKSPTEVLQSGLTSGAFGFGIGAAAPIVAAGVNKITGSIAERNAAKIAAEKAQKVKIENNIPDISVATKEIKNGSVVSDKMAQEVVRQGIPEADVALVKTGSAADKAKMIRMLDTRVAQRTNARTIDRASDVAGDTFIEKIVKPLQETNKKAAINLESVARSLKGNKVNATPAVEQFASDLENAGVRVGKGNRLIFKNSDFEGIKGAQTALQNAWNRAVRISRTGDALQLHRAKRFIDEVVDYGKATEGLSGRAQKILKNFRHGADQVLDAQFPRYNNANTVYSETINELGRIAESMGRNFRVGTPFADAKAGVVLRRLFSNTQSRAQLLQVLETSQNVAKKYGAQIDEDVITQAKFADLLEKMLGSEAPTSMQGIGEKVIGHAERGLSAAGDLVSGRPISAAMKAIKHGYDATRGINEENMIKALRELLIKEVKGAGPEVSNIGKAVTKAAKPAVKQSVFGKKKVADSAEIPKSAEFSFVGKPVTKEQIKAIEKDAWKKVDGGNHPLMEEFIDRRFKPEGEKYTVLKDPTDKLTYFHGTSKEDANSMLKYGIDTSKTSKQGGGESPHAFYVSHEWEAGMYGSHTVGVKLKDGETAKTIHTWDDNWGEISKKIYSASKAARESGKKYNAEAEIAKEVKKLGYDVVVHGDEIEILNPAKFEVVGGKNPKPKTTLGDRSGKASAKTILGTGLGVGAALTAIKMRSDYVRDKTFMPSQDFVEMSSAIDAAKTEEELNLVVDQFTTDKKMTEEEASQLRSLIGQKYNSFE